MGALELIETNEPRAQVPAVATPAHLLAIAVQNGADLDRLEKLMDLQVRWEANEARKAYLVARSGFKAEPIEIFKAKKVSFGDTKYWHAELSDITDAISSPMAKHQLSYRWDVTQSEGSITVTCIVSHVLGHSESVTMNAPPDNSGKKNTIQQIASTVTYLQRYTLLAAIGMSTKGMDDDGKGATASQLLSAGELADHLAAIDAASTQGELKTAYMHALEAGSSRADKDAVKQFTAAKDKKLASIGKAKQ